VLELIVGVVKFVPLPKELPPVEAAYHCKVPGPAAVRVTVPTPHLVAPELEVTVGLLTVTVTDGEYPGAPALHVTFSLKYLVAEIGPVLPLNGLV